MLTAEKRLKQRIVHIHSYSDHATQNNGQLGLVRTALEAYSSTAMQSNGMNRFG